MAENKIHKILLAVIRNLLAFIIGGVLGVVSTLLFAGQLLESAIKKDVGLGIIAVAPVIIIIYSFIFGAIGGIAGIIIYNLFKKLKRKV